MTTRDPRIRVPSRPDTGREGAREPTQSLQLDISGAPPDDEARDSHPSLAMGTSDVGREERTKIESPSGRNKTPQPRAPTKPPPTPARNADDPELRLGQVLGAYKLHELLGKGGMGYVFRAEHVKLGREVALKLLRGDYAKRRDAVLRFFQEAKTVNRVRHRNIVDVTDFVELPDGTTFIIMEFLRGQSLGKWARTGVDLPRALAVLVQICDGLGAAHAVGVVHRDLKPDNVIVVPTSDGAELVKLLDFGVAKLLNRDDEDIGFQTAAGSVIGTPAYMSPEQAGGMVVDHRSDIYSLGAIMYELFCGQPMFRGRSFGEYVRKHLTELPVPPRQTANGAAIEPALEALIMKCLAKDPNERFSHILELRDGLLHLLGGFETHPPSYAVLGQTGMPLPPPAMVTTVPTPPVVSSQILQLSSISGVGSSPSIYSQYSLPETAPPEPATPWWVWFVGGAFAVGLGIAGALWYAGASEPATQASPAAAPPVVQEPAPSPTASPIEQPPSAAKLVELRFDSLPSGGVYADGRSAELCRTPCRFNVDLGDGGPADHRTFVVRADGYQDARVDVDFAGTQRDFSVSLVRALPTVPTVTDQAPIVDMTGDESEDATAEKGSAKRSNGKKSKHADDKKTEKAAKSDKPDDQVADQATVKQEPPENDTKLEPIETKPKDKKQVGPIDPSDTIDPFRRNK
ncbi:MAG TPA: serine/threonine-protein kinase [Kofleriaceae bacterium]|nr:serine/threonine-protein kinase [Kofleriaceae bacterium]